MKENFEGFGQWKNCWAWNIIWLLLKEFVYLDFSTNFLISFLHRKENWWTISVYIVIINKYIFLVYYIYFMNKFIIFMQIIAQISISKFEVLNLRIRKLNLMMTMLLKIYLSNHSIQPLNLLMKEFKIQTVPSIGSGNISQE